MSAALHADAFAGMRPAFRDARDGETHLARRADGSLADRHLFHHLPARWIVERGAGGEPVALHPAIVAGYRRGATFEPVRPAGTAPSLDA